MLAVQVFRHALAVGDKVQRQTVADCNVKAAAKGHGFVELGQDAARQMFVAVTARDIERREASVGGSSSSVLMPSRLNSALLADTLVALAHADCIDQDQVAVGQIAAAPSVRRSVSSFTSCTGTENATIDASWPWAPIR